MHETNDVAANVHNDFLLGEWPNVVNYRNAIVDDNNNLRGGAEDYLHEAAEANNPASGTFYAPGGVRLASLCVHEHWNDSTNKQYSRNISPTNKGIELVAHTASTV